MSDIERKNEIDIVKIRGELKLLSEKIEVIKTNDLHLGTSFGITF